MRYVIAVLALLVGCLWLIQAGRQGVAAEAPTTEPAPSGDMQTAIFAGGCFWGVQERFDKVPGVISTEAGYTGGWVANPTYEQVCTHTTGHAEAVKITYDPKKVSYAELLDAFWSMHDPTTKDRQGPDVGSNYRSAIFYLNPEQEKIARESVAELETEHVFDGKIVTEIAPAKPFYPAEEYHQEYFAKNGGHCHNGVKVVHTKLAAEAKRGWEAGAQTK